MNTFLAQWRARREGLVVAPRPVAHNGMVTSRIAADSMADITSRLRLEVFEFVKACGWTGATCDEVEIALSMKHQTASARVNELMNSGHLVDSKRKRATSSGRPAIVWVCAGTSP